MHGRHEPNLQPIPVCKLYIYHAILASRKMEVGYSPSPYSSPLKGEEISAGIATPSARNDSKKGARNDRERRVQAQNGRWVSVNGFGNG